MIKNTTQQSTNTKKDKLQFSRNHAGIMNLFKIFKQYHRKY